eukprot:snap_masked-scaffold_34-processed-gene-1.29-mRNA-1 protein AED:1.00 eAED:1.00 QI:0/0/0/0/1/1/2/0/70
MEQKIFLMFSQNGKCKLIALTLLNCYSKYSCFIITLIFSTIKILAIPEDRADMIYVHYIASNPDIIWSKY